VATTEGNARADAETAGGAALVGFVNRDDERSRLLVPDDAPAHVAIALGRRSSASLRRLGDATLGAAALPQIAQGRSHGKARTIAWIAHDDEFRLAIGH
jgi:hypothetical protein